MMAVNKYEARLIKEIHEYLKTYGPTSARAITEDMNQRHKGNLTVHLVVGLLKKEENENRIVKTEVLGKMIIWGTTLE